MTLKGKEGAGHAPTIENSAVLRSYDTNVYINNDSITDSYFLQLQQHPLIRDFANVKPDTYDLVAHTNPTLKLLFDVCKDIVKEAGHE